MGVESNSNSFYYLNTPPPKKDSETFLKETYLLICMRQFKATQNTAQGLQSLHIRFIGKIIFMKGVQNSAEYVDKLIADFEKKGASILKGNGGWMRIDIVGSNSLIKLGDVELEVEEVTDKEIENVFFEFFSKKYSEAKFLVQEVVE